MNIQTGPDIIYLPRPRWRRGSGASGGIPGVLSGTIVGVSTLSGTLTIIPAANLFGTISGNTNLTGVMTGGGAPTYVPTYYLIGF